MNVVQYLQTVYLLSSMVLTYDFCTNSPWARREFLIQTAMKGATYRLKDVLLIQKILSFHLIRSTFIKVCNLNFYISDFTS